MDINEDFFDDQIAYWIATILTVPMIWLLPKATHWYIHLFSSLSFSLKVNLCLHSSSIQAFCSDNMSFLPVTKQTRKGASMNMMIGGAIAFVILGVVLGLGAIILAQFQNSSSVGGVNATAYTIIGNGLTALTTFSSWQNLLAIVIVAVIILTLVIGSIGRIGGGYTGGE